MRRHRFGVAAAATLAFLLIAFGVTMAVQEYRIALARGRANRQVSLSLAQDMNYWGEWYLRTGDAPRAESLVRKALTVQLMALPQGDWQVASTRVLLARCLAQEGRLVEAERLFLDAYPIIENQLGPGHPRLIAAVRQGAEIYETWGKPDRAAEWRKKLPPEPKK